MEALEPPLTKSEREALKSLYRLSRDGHNAHTGALGDAMGVSHATATTTVKRLAERGLVDHKLYRSVELTDTGKTAAVAAIRRHRIVERFLSDSLGYAWSEADRLAATFEHEIPAEVEDRLFMMLGRPTSCPHGFPIPEAEGRDISALPPLYDLAPGDVAVVALPGSTDPELVAFLETLGLRPGVVVEVREKHPFDGPIVVRVGQTDQTVGDRVARQIFVKKQPSREEQPV